MTVHEIQPEAPDRAEMRRRVRHRQREIDVARRGDRRKPVDVRIRVGVAGIRGGEDVHPVSPLPQLPRRGFHRPHDPAAARHVGIREEPDVHRGGRSVRRDTYEEDRSSSRG
jgi:hypothetical protein